MDLMFLPVTEMKEKLEVFSSSISCLGMRLTPLKTIILIPFRYNPQYTIAVSTFDHSLNPES